MPAYCIASDRFGQIQLTELQYMREKVAVLSNFGFQCPHRTGHVFMYGVIMKPDVGVVDTLQNHQQAL